MYFNHQLKVFLIPLRSTATISATGVAIQKKIYGSGMTTLIIWNEEMDATIKIVKFLEDADAFIDKRNQRNNQK